MVFAALWNSAITFLSAHCCNMFVPFCVWNLSCGRYLQTLWEKDFSLWSWLLLDIVLFFFLCLLLLLILLMVVVLFRFLFMCVLFVFVFLSYFKWRFPKMGLPPNAWFKMEKPYKWMIWGYPYFRKPPNCCFDSWFFRSFAAVILSHCGGLNVSSKLETVLSISIFEANFFLCSWP